MFGESGIGVFVNGMRAFDGRLVAVVWIGGFGGSGGWIFSFVNVWIRGLGGIGGWICSCVKFCFDPDGGSEPSN